MNAVLDYSVARPAPAVVRGAGYAGAVRYTGDYRYDGAIVTGDEWHSLKAAGLDVALVMEYDAAWLLRGYSTGHQLALAARAKERAMGIPDGLTYAAADFDITRGGPPVSAGALADCAAALDTMRGMADAYGGWQFVAPYGSKWFCEWVCAHSPMTRSWPTQAWSWVSGFGFEPAVNGVLWQYASWPQGIPIIGGCDFNLMRAADWGQRRAAPIPPVTPPIPPPGGNVILKTIDLNRQWDGNAAPLRTLRGLLSAWEITVDGKVISPDDASGDHTRRALNTFKQKAGLPVNDICDTATWNVLLGFVKA